MFKLNNVWILVCFLFFFRFYLFIFRERRRERERERNISVWLPLTHHLLGTWPKTQACALTGTLTSDRLFHRAALNPLTHTARATMCCYCVVVVVVVVVVSF